MTASREGMDRIAARHADSLRREIAEHLRLSHTAVAKALDGIRTERPTPCMPRALS